MVLRQIFAALVVTIAFASQAAAQALYRYKDENGNWVYSDRLPDDPETNLEEFDYDLPLVAPEVSIVRRSIQGGIALIAKSTYYSHTQIAYQISGSVNVALTDNGRLRGNRVLAPRSEVELLRLLPQDPRETMRFEIEYQYIPGEPGVEHRPSMPYRVPFALANSFTVSQAYPSTLSHGDPSSRHAIDFVMPVGTGVVAARAGVVIQIADGYFEAGVDPNTDLARANIVRILHDDGTMSLYAHLNWNSIRVRPGQRIQRGEYIADSGNTGFSTGPHLHFVVQRNIGSAIESIPLSFAGPGNSPIEYASGDLATAY